MIKMVRKVSQYLFLIFLSFTPVLGQTDDVKISYDLAQKQLSAGETQKALLTLEDILVKQPTYLPAQELKINILVKEERSKDAMHDIEEYISLYPSEPVFYYLRAVINLQREKYSKAIEDFDKAIQLDIPSDKVYKVYLNRGMAHFYNQDFELAEADFLEVVALDAKNGTAYHGLGMLNYEQSDYEEAISYFQRALKIDGKNAITHFNIAMSYFRLGDTDRACYHFNESAVLGHRNAYRLFRMECDVNLPQ